MKRIVRYSINNISLMDFSYGAVYFLAGSAIAAYGFTLAARGVSGMSYGAGFRKAVL